MKLNKWICTKTHYISDNFSVSLVYDIKNRVHYFLKGISSNLWDIIVKNQNFDKVKNYAVINNLENEFNSLLYELKEKNIIKINKNLDKSKHNYLSEAISTKSSNFEFFYNKWVEFICNLGLLNMLSFELNYKCNLKCKHCYNHKNMDKYHITYSQAKKVIDEAIDLGVSIISITGGECTINKDFLKIAKYVRSKYLELHINTNGQILNDNEKFFEELLKLYPSRIKVSLYSMKPEIHDYITGVKGSHTKTVNIIKKLKQAGADIFIITPVITYNKTCYKEVEEFANSIGVSINTNCLFINNPENNNLELKLDLKDIEQYYIDELTRKKKIGRKKFEKSNNAICEAGFERLCITPKLDVTPCVAVDYALGNLKNESLTKINDTTLKTFRKTFIRKNLTECFKEEYCEYCFYCSDTACFNNTFMKKQPILCENAKAYYNAVLDCKNKGQKL